MRQLFAIPFQRADAVFRKGHTDRRIFVQIAAYRDAELLPTLRDCLAKADNPEALTFGICWQHDDGESLAEFAASPAVRIKAVHYSRSRGACWARSETQKLFRGEAFTLQLDSHHRFIRGWDSAAISLLMLAQRQGTPKPILTSYAPPYEPGDDTREAYPLRLVFDGFSPEGPFRVQPVAIPAAQQGARLERARFLSAHFLFTLGQFCEEVPYDPSLYFFGEEPAMAIRAFTHGYDLFHPRETLLWHHYGRSSAPRHWSDSRRWSLRNERSLRRYRQLIGAGGNDTDLGSFGLGQVRSLSQYEDFAGLCLRERRASRRTLSGAPPLPAGLSRWYRPRMHREHVIDIPLTGLPEDLGGAHDDLLCIGLLDARHREVLRRDLHGDALASALVEGHVSLRVHPARAPVTCSLWPWQQHRGWGQRIEQSV